MRLNYCNCLLSLGLAYFTLIDQTEFVDYVAGIHKNYESMFIFMF